MPIFQDINSGGGAALDAIQDINVAVDASAAAWGSIVRASFTAADKTLTLPVITAADVGKKITVVNTGSWPFTIALNAGDIVSQVGLVISGGASVQIAAINAATAIVTSTNAAQTAVTEFGAADLTTNTTVTAAATTAATSINAPGMLFTVQSSGSFLVNFKAHINQTVANQRLVMLLVDTTAPTIAIASSELGLVDTNAVGEFSFSGSFLFSAIAGRSYQAKFFNAAGTVNVALITNTLGRTGLTYQKVSGLTATTGQSVEFVSGNLSSVAAIANNTTVLFETITTGLIPLAAGLFSLKANKTYRLSANMVTTAAAVFQWQTAAGVSLGGATTIFSPLIDTQVKLVNVSGTSVTPTAASRCLFDITQLGSSSAVVASRTSDYVFASPSASINTANTDIPFTVAKAGNLPVASSTFTLLAGKTYELEATISASNAAVAASLMEYGWVNTSNVLLPGSTLGLSVPPTSTDGSTVAPAKAIITTTANTVVKLRTTSTVANITSIQLPRSYAIIRQLGASPAVAPSIAAPTVVSFTANGTYTPTGGMTRCEIEIQAGNGGGGSALATAAGQIACGGGGGGGSYLKVGCTAAEIGASRTVTVAAAAPASTTAGAVSVTGIASCPGGAAGAASAVGTGLVTGLGGAAPAAGTVTLGRLLSSVAGTAGRNGNGAIFTGAAGGIGTWYSGGDAGRSFALASPTPLPDVVAILPLTAGSRAGVVGSGQGAVAWGGSAAVSGATGLTGFVRIVEYYD